MPTTTNFGWTTPADTDLVKDGALAIRTLGNGVDTSLVDLKGGTTGQALTKASNTDLDYSWINVIPESLIDAKGDIITATAADTAARLAVGANNTILTADSTASTGLAWKGDWISYTPTWTGTTTNPAIGNGTITGGYFRIGNWVTFYAQILAGSTTTYGSGNYRVGLPVAANTSNWSFNIRAQMVDTGVAWYTNYYGTGSPGGLSTSFELINTTTAAVWSPTSPFTFGNLDSVFIQGSYRV